MSVTETGNERGFAFWRGRLDGAEVLLVQTGIGKAKAAQATRVTLERFAPSVVVSTGFAGGTQASLAAGDLAIADRVWSCSGDPLAEPSATTMSSACAPKLVELARECAAKAKTPHQVGGILTVDQVVAEAERKHRVGQKFGVLAVEMESAAVAEVAVAAGTPFLCVRSISDAVDQDLHLESFRIATP
ncbi:MAG: 5'-methylthioadenosine/S-adenosylhomocysteine nucleosidase, partial [Planctomycetes bacterium]|nr:5'-methylthioadenosine/S-adenosylhomocysteine nucleosidase [Planctomycetota bacterium]